MSKKKQILIVEDDENIHELIRYNLSNSGYKLLSAIDGEAALKHVRNEKIDLVLLDIMLPGMDGIELCRVMKGDVKLAAIPIIFVSARGEESDVVVGLELGADDYITKPFSIKVLQARIRAVLRRHEQKKSDPLAATAHKDLMIDPLRHRVTFKDKLIDLTATEFSMLHFLAQHPGWVFTRQQIVDSVKGTDYAVTERSVDVQIVGIRKKLGTAAELIETVRGIGYRFQE
ncbi:MAG: response regulator [Spartobacteria bacterium]|nr:response regulator [Spartobacteria bacterium]